MKENRVFIVELLRWGNRENHSYIVGVFSTYEKALHAASLATEVRGGKYDAEIQEAFIDSKFPSLYRKLPFEDRDVVTGESVDSEGAE